ncbi:hypothetical protein ARMGADRAFT_1077231 [Armillaria gallica]|uniref:Uncharacterized protein n=1 Tax=Armillaria gallica TaxID=47427 RepID=A0A2H3DSS7_ARMGA|nr:hypothetical protein ARMGADRAFT_1077231 [Armillaria gallica]
MNTLTTYTLDTGLTALPPHLPTLLASLAFFTFIRLVVAPLTSHAFFPDTYGKMGRRARNKWLVPFSRSVFAVHVWAQVYTRRVPSTRLAGHPTRAGVSEPRSVGPVMGLRLPWQRQHQLGTRLDN